MPDGDVPNFEGLTPDEAALVALGYKQEFKREFSLWTTFCVSFAVLGLLPSFASTLYYGMGYAGTGGMVWGWLISWIFSMYFPEDSFSHPVWAREFQESFEQRE